MTLSRSASRGFQIGFRRWRWKGMYIVVHPVDASKKRFSWFPRPDLQNANVRTSCRYRKMKNEYLRTVQKSISIGPRTSPPTLIYMPIFTYRILNLFLIPEFRNTTIMYEDWLRYELGAIFQAGTGGSKDACNTYLPWPIPTNLLG